MKPHKSAWPLVTLAGVLALALAGTAVLTAKAPAAGAASGYVVHDGHVHLTNYIQEGPTAR